MHDVSGEGEKMFRVVWFYFLLFFFQEVEKRCNNKGCEKKVPRREAHTERRNKNERNFKEVFGRTG